VAECCEPRPSPTSTGPSSSTKALGWRKDADFIGDRNFWDRAADAARISVLEQFGSDVTPATPGPSQGLLIVGRGE
jgi:hypothetical protein